MGLFGWMKRQFIDVIEWTGPSYAWVWRFPRHDSEIKNGAKLTVREGQVAILVSEGQLGDVYTPGLYTLSTQNMPVLTSLSSWKYGFESPFKAEVYFINTTPQLDLRWGTLQPIPVRDAEFGVIRLRAFGNYTIQVTADQATTFFKEIVGTSGLVTTESVEGQVRGHIAGAFAKALSQAKVPALDLAGHYDVVAAAVSDRMTAELTAYGLTLKSFLIHSISLPAEVNQALDTRASMAATGDLSQFTQYQAAKALTSAGSGMGMGQGFAMGQMMALQTGATAAAAMAGASPASTPAAAGPSVTDRLKELKGLHEAGLIDAEAFASKRDTLLAEL